MDVELNIPKSNKPRVVVIGGGFAGIEFSRALPEEDFQLVMIDRNNYHTFQPLLYQVATAGLEPDSIASPLRKMFDNRSNYYFRWTSVEKIIPQENYILTGIGRLDFDILVIAAGSKTNFFGNKEMSERAFEMKQIPQALDLRSQILQNFEKATITADPLERDSLMDYVIVGGGPTGVELSGALAELKTHVLPSDYPELDFSLMNIYLIEGSPTLLGPMSKFSQEKAFKYLHKMGVEIKLNARVQSYDGKKVKLVDGTEINSSTVIWAAGVSGSIIDGLKEESIFKGRYKVDEYNKIIGSENIYAIGDIAAMVSTKNPNGHPMVSPVAMQQGKNLGNNLKRKLKNETLKPFEYFDKGSMATVGRNKAIVDFPHPFDKLHLGGIFAWMAWMFVHIFYITVFRNKLLIFINWLWSYLTYDKGNRLIIRPFKRESNKPQAEIKELYETKVE